ncbi:MAG: hypothetical protein PHO26_00095 [Dehalococcoidia bacterium]|nr:hypothetical protein [Dehalococcoidia bacterium]MDD5493830.1 hypothetical protein [Dehalococcoidia bacterium]
MNLLPILNGKMKYILSSLSAGMMIFIAVVSGCAEVRDPGIEDNTKQAVTEESHYQPMMDAYMASHDNNTNNVFFTENDIPDLIQHSCYYTSRTFIYFPDDAPCVNQEKPLKAAVWMADKHKHVDIKINLPEGIDLTRGDTTWSGAMSRGETVVMQIMVRPVKPGDYKIGVEYYFPAEWDSGMGASTYEQFMYTLITETAAVWSQANPIWHPKPRIEKVGIDGSVTYMTEEEERILEEGLRKANTGHVPAGITEDGTVIPSK